MARHTRIMLLLPLLTVWLPAAWGEEPTVDSSSQAQAALDRAQSHITEAFKALQEAGSLLYQDKMPPLRNKSHRMVEELLGEAEKMLNDLQHQLKNQLQTPPGGGTPPAAPPQPPALRPPQGGGDRFI